MISVQDQNECYLGAKSLGLVGTFYTPVNVWDYQNYFPVNFCTPEKKHMNANGSGCAPYGCIYGIIGPVDVKNRAKYGVYWNSPHGSQYPPDTYPCGTKTTWNDGNVYVCVCRLAGKQHF